MIERHYPKHHLILFYLFGIKFFACGSFNPFGPQALAFSSGSNVYFGYGRQDRKDQPRVPISSRVIVDILTLSSLYLLRIIAGGALLDIALSNWLLTFSVFFFLFLASVKRWVELNKQSSEVLSGRGYKRSDKSFISNLSYFSGLISVLVICLYIESQQALSLYQNSKILWLVPIILLYWILETLFKVERGQIDDDPVKYALKSKNSYISLIGLLLVSALSYHYFENPLRRKISNSKLFKK